MRIITYINQHLHQSVFMNGVNPLQRVRSQLNDSSLSDVFKVTLAGFRVIAFLFLHCKNRLLQSQCGYTNKTTSREEHYLNVLQSNVAQSQYSKFVFCCVYF